MESFAEVFRDAMARKGMTLVELRRRLQRRGISVSMSTLSYWRSRQRQPDADAQEEAIAEIERILDLHEGQLARLAVRRLSAAGLPAETVPLFPRRHGQADVAAAVARMLEVLRTGIPQEWQREVSMQVVVDVGVDGYPVHATVSSVIQCVEGRIDRMTYWTTSPYGNVDKAKITLDSGGRVVDQFMDELKVVKGVLIELDAPMKAGDTVMMVEQLDYEPGIQERSVLAAASRPAKKLALWARFHPDALPAWLKETETVSEGERTRMRGLDAPASAHMVRWGYGPGSILLEWGYGDPAVEEPEETPVNR